MPVHTVNNTVHREVELGTGFFHRLGLEAGGGTLDPIKPEILELLHLVLVRVGAELNRLLDLSPKGRILGEGKISEGKGAGSGGNKVSTVHADITMMGDRVVNAWLIPKKYSLLSISPC